MNVTGSRHDVLSGLLDIASLRHRVIAQNIANVNTPGYRRLTVSFEREMERALGKGDASALTKLKPHVTEAVGGVERADGNNVDVNLEMGQLDQNTLIYRTLVQALSLRLTTMRSAITGH